jgi:Flp pilus assembly protein TadD
MDKCEYLASVMRLLDAGDWTRAEAAALAAEKTHPGDPNARLLTGLAIAAMGEADRAAPVLNGVAAAMPDACHPCIDLADLRPALPASLVSRQFRACLALAPADGRLRRAYAGFLLDQDQPAEVETLLADMPGDAAAHHLKGLARAEMGRFPAAITSFKIAVAVQPSAAANWSNLGMMMKTEGRFQQAIGAHDRAVTLSPAEPRLRVNRAVALLKGGYWEPAWRDYECRLDLTDSPLIDKTRLLPTVSFGDRLDGHTIVALHEDGFGDTLQFLRYLPLLADRGARVIACVPPELARIMQRIRGVARVVSDPADLPPHDFICPMFSLPRVFATTVDSIPPSPLLTFEPRQVTRFTGLRVGLVWAGQARPSLPGFRALDRRRSAGLAAFAPLAGVSAVRFVSLQAGPPARQERPPGLMLEDPMADVRDFADTAAIIAGLDAVVSVDTSVVHLAGLLGKPVLMLDRYDGCWRWLHGRADSPWYPNLRIFRQDEPGDWTAPVARIAAALDARMVFPQQSTEAA